MAARRLWTWRLVALEASAARSCLNRTALCSRTWGSSGWNCTSLASRSFPWTNFLFCFRFWEGSLKCSSDLSWNSSPCPSPWSTLAGIQAAYSKAQAYPPTGAIRLSLRHHRYAGLFVLSSLDIIDPLSVFQLFLLSGCGNSASVHACSSSEPQHLVEIERTATPSSFL